MRTVPASKLPEVMDRLNNLEPVLQLIGQIIRTYAAKSFMAQRFGNEEWPPVHVPKRQIIPTTSGNIRGPFIKNAAGRREYRTRPALIETGTLLNAVKSAPIVTSNNWVQVGISSPIYAQTHNEGLNGVKRRTFLGVNEELDMMWTQAVENYLVDGL